MREIWLVHDAAESPWERCRFLERAGYSVTALSSSRECLALLERRYPDLLLLDVLLDGQNGFELCRAVRARPGSAHVPIVLGSEVYSADLFRAEAARAGAQAFLADPYDLNALLAAVDHVLVARDADAAQAAA